MCIAGYNRGSNAASLTDEAAVRKAAGIVREIDTEGVIGSCDDDDKIRQVPKSHEACSSMKQCARTESDDDHVIIVLSCLYRTNEGSNNTTLDLPLPIVHPKSVLRPN
jgi:hypothetical protein